MSTTRIVTVIAGLLAVAGPALAQGPAPAGGATGPAAPATSAPAATAPTAPMNPLGPAAVGAPGPGTTPGTLGSQVPPGTFETPPAASPGTLATTPFGTIPTTPFGTVPTTPFATVPVTPFVTLATTPFGTFPTAPSGTFGAVPFGTVPTAPFGAVPFGVPDVGVAGSVATPRALTPEVTGQPGMTPVPSGGSIMTLPPGGPGR